MDCSTPGFPVHHQLLDFTQTHFHWIGDAIQPSHPLSSPSPPAFNLSQHQGLFQWVSSSGGQSIGVSASVSVLPMNILIGCQQVATSLVREVSTPSDWGCNACYGVREELSISHCFLSETTSKNLAYCLGRGRLMTRGWNLEYNVTYFSIHMYNSSGTYDIIHPLEMFENVQC